MNIDKNGFIINSNINFIYSKLYLMFIKIIKIILHFIFIKIIINSFLIITLPHFLIKFTLNLLYL